MADKLSVVEDELSELPRIVILRLRNMTAIDGTGISALECLADRLVKSGRHLLLCGMRDQPARLMAKAEFHRHLGEANIVDSLTEAIVRAKGLLRAEQEG